MLRTQYRFWRMTKMYKLNLIMKQQEKTQTEKILKITGLLSLNTIKGHKRQSYNPLFQSKGY